MDLVNAPEQSLRDGPSLALLEQGGRQPDPDRILADRVEQLYDQLWIGILGAFVVGGIATFELWEPQYRDLTLFWCTLVVLASLASAALLVAYRRARNRLADAQGWMRRLGLAAIAIGAVWGFAGAVFFPAHADEQQVFLAFLLAGIVTGGIPVLSGSWPIYALFAASVLAPFAYVLANFGNRLFAELAALVPVFYAVNVAIAYRLAKVFGTGYRLRHAYSELTEDYRALNRRLGDQLLELQAAGRQVEESGRKLALFADRAPIAVIEIQTDGRIHQINPAAELLFGYAPVETLVAPAAQAEFRQHWQTLLETRTPLLAQLIPNLRRDGLEVVCEWTVTPLVNPDGRVLSIVAQGRDMSSQLEAERMKKEFTSTLSHELRTPLTSIIGSLQLVNSGAMGSVDKDVLELTVIAERNGQRLLDLINDLLDVEKIRSGKFDIAPEVLAVDDVVKDALLLNRAFAERYGVRLVLTGSLPATRVHADRKRLLQVLTNLISNAAKFSPEGETVEVGLEDRGSRLRVKVLDRGPGIPQDFRAKIFTRFSQADATLARQKGGTGLGLAICKHLIELMSGQIGFQDRAGGGSVFWIELPMHDVSQTRKED
ncbi:MAG: HAMP domain-containing sensor histidine kinase [Burkholderiales bacterium]|nr:HAMP domain-containing sensor histidine kinase [Burkholderiales bacterium]